MVKNPPASAETHPWVRRIPWRRGNGNPLQYSGAPALDRESGGRTVPRESQKSQTGLSEEEAEQLWHVCSIRYLLCAFRSPLASPRHKRHAPCRSQLLLSLRSVIMSARFQTPCWVLGGMEFSLERPEFHLEGIEG